MYHQLFCTGSFIIQIQTGEFVLQPCFHAVEHAPSPTVDAFTLSLENRSSCSANFTSKLVCLLVCNFKIVFVIVFVFVLVRLEKLPMSHFTV